jgi:murein DD-endopeptidase MepM/ murein hydrolase activator NlpD
MFLPSRWKLRAAVAAIIFSAILSACATPPATLQPPTVTYTPSPAPTEQTTPTPSRTPVPNPTAPPQPTPSPSATLISHPAPAPICSPLEGEPLSALTSPDLLKNPFVAARAGYDDGHPGIDLAYWSRPDGKPMLGLPIHSLFAGTVAFTIQNRPPFGNAVVIETSLATAPFEWLKQRISATPAQNLQPSFSLVCPDYKNFKADSPDTALYVLYAHLNHTSLVKPGDTVACAQPIGEVGTTGNSVNPHLHLEIRGGPAGVRFASMAHYDPAATQAELRAYCLWRVSGAFPAIDLLSILSQPTPAP